ncbi:MAG: hypothetical protein Q3997_01155 [Propionibacteriaceae bacterium]|nr:hypothetical protein [Propionibacteriaceae bacterium]
MTQRIVHALVVLAGLALTGWGLGMLAASSASCRGVAMGPGDTCYYASPGEARTQRVQTYEERVSAVRSSAPVVMGLGVLTAAFGAFLFVQEIRRPARQTAADQSGNSDIGP